MKKFISIVVALSMLLSLCGFAVPVNVKVENAEEVMYEKDTTEIEASLSADTITSEFWYFQDFENIAPGTYDSFESVLPNDNGSKSIFEKLNGTPTFTVVEEADGNHYLEITYSTYQSFGIKFGEIVPHGIMSFDYKFPQGQNDAHFRYYNKNTDGTTNSGWDTISAAPNVSLTPFTMNASATDWTLHVMDSFWSDIDNFGIGVYQNPTVTDYKICMDNIRIWSFSSTVGGFMNAYVPKTVSFNAGTTVSDTSGVVMPENVTKYVWGDFYGSIYGDASYNINPYDYAPTAAPAGYEFDGWSLTDGGAKLDNEAILVPGNMTFYAIWKEVKYPTGAYFEDFENFTVGDLTDNWNGNAYYLKVNDNFYVPSLINGATSVKIVEENGNKFLEITGNFPAIHVDNKNYNVMNGTQYLQFDAMSTAGGNVHFVDDSVTSWANSPLSAQWIPSMADSSNWTTVYQSTGISNSQFFARFNAQNVTMRFDNIYYWYVPQNYTDTTVTTTFANSTVNAPADAVTTIPSAVTNPIYKGDTSAVVDLSDVEATTTNTAYTFKGWSLKDNGSVLLADTYKPVVNQTLYAVWEKVEYPAITYFEDFEDEKYKVDELINLDTFDGFFGFNAGNTAYIRADETGNKYLEVTGSYVFIEPKNRSLELGGSEFLQFDYKNITSNGNGFWFYRNDNNDTHYHWTSDNGTTSFKEDYAVSYGWVNKFHEHKVVDTDASPYFRFRTNLGSSTTYYDNIYYWHIPESCNATSVTTTFENSTQNIPENSVIPQAVTNPIYNGEASTVINLTNVTATTTDPAYAFKGWSLTDNGNVILTDTYKPVVNQTLYAVWESTAKPAAAYFEDFESYTVGQEVDLTSFEGFGFNAGNTAYIRADETGNKYLEVTGAYVFIEPKNRNLELGGTEFLQFDYKSAADARCFWFYENDDTNKWDAGNGTTSFYVWYAQSYGWVNKYFKHDITDTTQYFRFRNAAASSANCYDNIYYWHIPEVYAQTTATITFANSTENAPQMDKMPEAVTKSVYNGDNETVDISTIVPQNVPEGYTFVGWSYSDNGSAISDKTAGAEIQYNSNKATMFKPVIDQTLYAVWEDDKWNESKIKEYFKPVNDIMAIRSDVKVNNNNQMGVRMVAKLEDTKRADITESQMGFIVTRTKILEANGMSANDFTHTFKGTKVEGLSYDTTVNPKVDRLWINYNATEFTAFSAVMVGIPVEMYNDELVFRPFIRFTYNDNEYISYGEPVSVTVLGIAQRIKETSSVQTDIDYAQSLIDAYNNAIE